MPLGLDFIFCYSIEWKNDYIPIMLRIWENIHTDIFFWPKNSLGIYPKGVMDKKTNMYIQWYVSRFVCNSN